MRGYTGTQMRGMGGRPAPGLGVVRAGKKREKKQSIRPKDQKKLQGWKYRPSDALYLQYKAVYDNKKYYNQKTGEIHWPANSGFAEEPQEKILESGTRIDRYGFDSGTFTSPVGTAYNKRAVAPGTNLKPYSVFRVKAPIKVKAGKIAPWFDEPGGGIQYEMPESIKNLLKGRVIKRE